MSKLKLMSVLQSRINKRSFIITRTTKNCGAKFARFLGEEQKQDKAILRQLIVDEREIKEWKAMFDTSSKVLGIIASMKED